ncbi:MAG: AI-2E family transporter [Actinobacteria bacterium]|nr:AI-2E family transporter [Actinomycetota bacterium]MBW3650167.1 AI-2E family transporter [Actinomycetota bacterium]
MTENLLPGGPSAGIKQAGQVAWALVGLAALLAVAGVVAWQVRVIFPPLLLAGAIVFILNPVVTALQQRGVPRAAGAGLAYLGVLAIVGAAGLGLFPIAANQVDELAEDLPDIRSRVERWVDDRAEQSVGTFYEFSRADVEASLSNSSASFEDQLRSLRKIGASVFHALLILVLAPIIAFYLLVDVPHLRNVAESLIPIGARDEVLVVGHRLNRAIGGFFRGQLMVALIVGVLCSVGLGIIGLKFWFLIGMIAGLFNVIPLIGPWVGGIPGVTIALTTGSPLQALLVVGVMVGVQQFDNHFITPQVMQRAVHLHPAVVILALVAGGSLGGFYGLLLAVPLTAVLKIIISHLWRVHILRQPLDSIDAETRADDTEKGTGMVGEVDSRPENQPVAAAARP